MAQGLPASLWAGKPEQVGHGPLVRIAQARSLMLAGK
jgi:hypothetical protein